MELIHEESIRLQALKEVARKMLIAARTAPKARGVDNTVLVMIEDRATILEISEKMRHMGETYQMPAFTRDAENISETPILLLMGTRLRSVDLKKCGLCGHANCHEKNQYPHIPCAFNSGDLGIAIGSAVSVAMDHRVDNRIMYTVGQAVLELGLLGSDIKIVYAIPLNAGPKNPFFDRK
ncbi:MAG: ferredoxin [Oligoflexia bacterium]|nr:ferredoxin [Oligoflexia bacterium]